MRETRSSGSVRGASGDGRPYRESSPAACPRRDERPESARKPGVQGGKGELLGGVENCRSRFARPVMPGPQNRSFIASNRLPDSRMPISALPLVASKSAG